MVLAEQPFAQDGIFPPGISSPLFGSAINPAGQGRWCEAQGASQVIGSVTSLTNKDIQFYCTPAGIKAGRDLLIQLFYFPSPPPQA